jgi:hypothetical protein
VHDTHGISKGTLSGSPARRRSAVRIQDPIIPYLINLIRARLAAAHHDREGGYSTEAVIVIGLLVAGAIIAVGYIVVKIKAAAQSIQTQ